MLPIGIQTLLLILAFLTTWLLLWSAIAWPLFLRFQWRPLQPTAPDQKLILLLPLYAIAPLLLWATLRFTHQSWATIGWLGADAGRSLPLGFGIAILGLALLLGLKRITGTLSFHPAWSDTASRVGSVPMRLGMTLVGIGVIAIGIAGVEELIFRGWLQTQLEGILAPWLAATLGSALFAIAHLLWDGKAGLWQQPGLWLLGWVLVVARWADGSSLALAWGLHAGWVWGLAVIATVLQPQVKGNWPIWWAGRTDQPLTSIGDLSLLGLTAAIIWWGSQSPLLLGIGG